MILSNGIAQTTLGERMYDVIVWFGSLQLTERIVAEDGDAAVVAAELAYPNATLIVAEPVV